jgi:hypothetical protein
MKMKEFVFVVVVMVVVVLLIREKMLSGGCVD